MRTRRLTLIFTGLGIGLVLLAGALLLSLPFLVDLPRIQALLRAEASRLLDRPVRFERVSIGLWRSGDRVRGLSVANGRASVRRCSPSRTPGSRPAPPLLRAAVVR
jgi:hypothetical protein